MMEPRSDPTEYLSWQQVAAAVPAEAAALESVLKTEGSDIDEFVPYWYDRASPAAEEAWNRLADAFERTTGLRVEPYWVETNDKCDEDWEGYRVVGAWQLSPAGRRFFGITDEEGA
jgi:hypothetical protein